MADDRVLYCLDYTYYRFSFILCNCFNSLRLNLLGVVKLEAFSEIFAYVNNEKCFSEYQVILTPHKKRSVDHILSAFFHTVLE